MKKITDIILTAFLLLAVSCSSDDANIVTPGEISFARPVMRGVTRAEGDAYAPQTGEMVNPYNQNERFVVFGKKYVPPYSVWGNINDSEYDGEVAHYDDKYKGWNTDVRHHWKSGYKYVFAAYSPADPDLKGKVTYDDKGFKITDFAAGNINKQYDLLYTSRIKDIDRSSMVPGGQDKYAGVPLVFSHALASVRVKISIDPDFVTAAGVKEGDYKIKNISLVNVLNKGTFNQNITEGTSTSENPIWTYENTVGTDYIETMALTDNTVTENNPIIVPITGGPKLISDGLRGHDALLIPQDLKGQDKSDNATEDDVYLVIEWTGNGNEKDKVWNTDSINLSKHGAWKTGLRYTYSFVFQEGRITFAPSVDGWGLDTSKDKEEKKQDF